MPPVVFIVGPTAVGKTDLSFYLAEKTKGAVLNADSIQIYKDLNVGSSKPDFSKHPEVDCFLFDVVSAPEVWTAGIFRKKSLEILKREVPNRNMFVVGGSGFYIQALEKGMYDLKPIPDSVVKELKDLEKEKGLSVLYKELQVKDPQLASRISPQDQYRIFRSLCVMRNEGKSLSQIKEDFVPKKLPWAYKKIGLNIAKEELLPRVEERAKSMIKRGLIEEVEPLFKQGHESWKPLQSVGYKEVLSYFKGSIKKEDLVSEIVKNTMSLAKKQKTWFQKDKSIQWFDFKEDAVVIEKFFADH